MTPAFAKKLARLIVVPCDRGGCYHTFDPLTHRSHTVRDTAGTLVCDCIHSQYRQGCAHSRKVRFHIDSAAESAAQDCHQQQRNTA